jgi:hypothetical protein
LDLGKRDEESVMDIWKKVEQDGYYDASTNRWVITNADGNVVDDVQLDDQGNPVEG